MAQLKSGILASVLLGCISAAVVFDGADAVASPLPVGQRLPVIGHLHFAPAVLRTRAQVDEFQAAHPMLGLKQPGYRPLIPMGMKAYRLAKQLAMQAVHGERPAAPPVHPAMPTHRALGAAGPTQNDPDSSTFRPDPSVAIGGNQIVVVVDGTYNVYNRRGQLLLHESLDALLGTANTVLMPRVVYDPVWNRWVLFVIDAPNPSAPPAVWFAISASSNAMGSMHIYHTGLPFPNGDVWDYPMIGLTQDAVLGTGNYFSGGGATFGGSLLFGIAKARLYNGLSWGAQLIGAPAASGTIAPPIVEDSKDTAYFVGANTSGATLDVYVGSNFETGSPSFAASGTISVSNLAVPPPAPQYNATQTLDTLDARFEGPSSQYTDGGSGHIVLWNIHTISAAGFPTAQAYEIDTSSNTLAQTLDFYDTGTSYDFSASMAVNQGGEAFVNWNSTDPNNHGNAKVLYSGWQPGDSTAIVGGSVLVNAGPALRGNTESGSLQYWGSYSAIALDPSPVAQCSGAANRRAVTINERTIDYKTWGTEFGIFGYC